MPLQFLLHAGNRCVGSLAGAVMLLCRPSSQTHAVNPHWVRMAAIPLPFHQPHATTATPGFPSKCFRPQGTLNHASTSTQRTPIQLTLPLHALETRKADQAAGHPFGIAVANAYAFVPHFLPTPSGSLDTPHIPRIPRHRLAPARTPTWAGWPTAPTAPTPTGTLPFSAPCRSFLPWPGYSVECSRTSLFITLRPRLSALTLSLPLTVLFLHPLSRDMADIPQFDEDMELTDDMLEGMDLPDDPSGSNLPRTRSPTELPAPKKPCVETASDIPPHEPPAATSVVTEGHVDAPGTRTVVTLLFPEPGADAIRPILISKLFAKLTPSLFDCGYVPEARATNGDTLCFAGRVYASICFSWPTRQSANEFLPVFRNPIELSPCRSITVKPYIDPHPDLTEAKANGAPVLSLRRVPARFEDSDLLVYLVPRWLTGINSFHRMKDPYAGVFLILTGIPIPLPEDPDFLTIPALIPTGGNAPDILVNVSSHECSICASNHRVEDHAIFPCERKGHLNNKAQLTVAAEGECYRLVAGSFKASLFAVRIPKLLATANVTAPKETFYTWSFSAFQKKGDIEAFLKRMKLMARA
ncbi:unnamed protein product [Closterium sp. Naga37s-1]|nr:unnamed protein product [Closterium sp. Naga37s-1]